MTLTTSESFTLRRRAAHELRAQLDRGGCCPFCLRPMTRSTLPGRGSGSDRTRAHVYPRAHERDDRAVWVFACRDCNTDQGGRTLDGWARYLWSRGDSRWRHVRGVLNRAHDLGIM